MSTEFTFRQPHTRTYKSAASTPELVSVFVSHKGVVKASEELIHLLLSRAGYVETTVPDDAHDAADLISVEPS